MHETIGTAKNESLFNNQIDRSMNAKCIAFAPPASLRARRRMGAAPNTRKKYVRLKLVGRVAQLVEQRPFKAWVAGSIPAALTIFPAGMLKPADPHR